MTRISSTVHLGVLSCIFCTTLAAFLALLCAILWRLPIRGRRLQTLALLSKLILDLVPTTLGALNSSKRIPLEEGSSGVFLSSGLYSNKRLGGIGIKTSLVDYILLCCSSICITSLEVSLRSVDDVKRILMINCSTSTYGLRMRKSLRKVSGGRYIALVLLSPSFSIFHYSYP